MSTRDVVTRIAAATLVGAILGLNRELKDKPAGIRTHALVSLGAALLIITAINVSTLGGVVDPAGVTRVMQGIITGIGFLGAGVIMRRESSQSVSGLTTAASVWIAACLGIACGVGQWITSLIAVTATLLVLTVGTRVESFVHRRIHKDATD